MINFTAEGDSARTTATFARRSGASMSRRAAGLGSGCSPADGAQRPVWVHGDVALRQTCCGEAIAFAA
jgi:hypothetical protein